MKYLHFFFDGSCLFCHKPIDFMAKAYPWRGGWILPPDEEQEECEAYKKWHQEAERNAKAEIKEA